MARVASIDFETYSEAGYAWDGVRWSGDGLRSVGHHLYARHPSTEVLCLAWRFGDGGAGLWRPGWGLPEALLEHVRAGGHVSAWNSEFEFQIWEHVCVSRYGFPRLPAEQLWCSAARARVYGLPGKLHDAALFFPGPQKHATGAKLLRRYAVPRTPSANDGRRRRFLPGDFRFRGEASKQIDPFSDEAKLFAYCQGDVDAERSVADQCPPLSPLERKLFLLDRKINDRGVAVDMVALALLWKRVLEIRGQAFRDTQRIVPGLLPTQVERMREELAVRGIPVSDLQRDTVASLLERVPQSPARTLLEARLAVSHGSVAKLDSIRRRVCADGRVRGLLQYYGAERTGRWAGRGPQPQNLPRGDGRSAPFEGPVDSLDDVSSALRSVFVAGAGCRFLAADFSAIEAVVLAELAGETWRQEAFRAREDIYVRAAALVTGVPPRPDGTHEHRQIGKIAELASGYGGGVGAWRSFGAQQSEEELRALVRRWRDASPNVVRFWYDLEDAAKAAIRNPGFVARARGIAYVARNGTLACVLPSGRALYYHRAGLRIGTTPWGAEREQITYYGRDTYTRGWGDLRTYGGKLCENVVQAVARDLLAWALLRVEAAGFRVVLHVHDEIVTEVPEQSGSVEDLCNVMAQLPAWASGWPVHADGWAGRRYRKG